MSSIDACIELILQPIIDVKGGGMTCRNETTNPVHEQNHCQVPYDKTLLKHLKYEKSHGIFWFLEIEGFIMFSMSIRDSGEP